MPHVTGSPSRVNPKPGLSVVSDPPDPIDFDARGMCPALPLAGRLLQTEELISQYRSQQSRNLGNPYQMAAKFCQFRSLIAGSGTQRLDLN